MELYGIIWNYMDLYHADIFYFISYCLILLYLYLYILFISFFEQLSKNRWNTH